MSSIPHRRALLIGLAGVIFFAVVAWVVGARIRSPAQIAAETAAPEASLITVPVEEVVLSTEVVVRGTVRYGAPQAVVLATSSLKQGSDIVSQPPRLGANLKEGSVAMSVSGRPVFVLRGAQPMSRDLGSDAAGQDVRQLEEALVRRGFAPGPVDGRYDSATAAAVAAWYQQAGWAPFAATDAQIEQLRGALATAATTRDALLQARLALKTAESPATPAEVNQARTEAVTADDAVDTAELAVRSADADARAAVERAARARDAVSLATTTGARDTAVAEADLFDKQTALNLAIEARDDAQAAVAAAPPGAPNLALLQSNLDDAIAAVPVARRHADAASAAVIAAREAARTSIAQAQADANAASDAATVAASQRTRARKALVTARRQAGLAHARVTILTRSVDTTLQRQVVAAAESDVRRATDDAARLAARAGIQVPADEVLFFPALPLRVDDSTVKRGESASGTVMTVSNSQLAADSSLSLSDAKLVRVGMPVTIEEQDLGITVRGVVTRVADKPGTDKVDPTRVYFEVTPRDAPARLVGASVRLSIAVQSTEGAVLAVPLSALSVGADGSSRVQVDRGGGVTEYVTVVPGLATNGLVEVQPVVDGALEAGDLVVVGTGGSVPAGSAGTGQGGTASGTGTTTGQGTGTSTEPGTGTSTEPGGSTTTEPGTGTTTEPGGSTTTGTGTESGTP
jgi:hypothetical protein